METASHMSRGRMLKNERGTSTPSLLTQQTVSPWLLDKLERDGKDRDNLPPVLKHILCPSQTVTWALSNITPRAQSTRRR